MPRRVGPGNKGARAPSAPTAAPRPRRHRCPAASRGEASLHFEARLRNDSRCGDIQASTSERPPGVPPIIPQPCSQQPSTASGSRQCTGLLTEAEAEAARLALSLLHNLQLRELPHHHSLNQRLGRVAENPRPIFVPSASPSTPPGIYHQVSLPARKASTGWTL